MAQSLMMVSGKGHGKVVACGGAGGEGREHGLARMEWHNGTDVCEQEQVRESGGGGSRDVCEHGRAKRMAPIELRSLICPP